MDIIEILKADYQRFPEDQTYNIYGDEVYFKDPLNEFRGVQRYQEMIHFLSTFFTEVQMDLHEIHRNGNIIHTDWTLHLTPPLPWKPQISIPGRSELEVNNKEKISSHRDFWHCSPFDVLKQVFSSR